MNMPYVALQSKATFKNQITLEDLVISVINVASKFNESSSTFPFSKMGNIVLC